MFQRLLRDSHVVSHRVTRLLRLNSISLFNSGSCAWDRSLAPACGCGAKGRRKFLVMRDAKKVG